VALAVILRQSWSSVVLSGAAAGEHLLSNLKAVEVAEQLDHGKVSQLLETLAETPVDYWANRSKLSWN